MIRTLAIQSDFKSRPNGTVQSFSNIWSTLAGQYDINIKFVDVYSHDFLDQLSDVDAFMWRISPTITEVELGKRLLPIIADKLGIPTFPGPAVPDWIDDKVWQSYLFRAANVPAPQTLVFWDSTNAINFLKNTDYPLVIKLSRGAASSNVGLIQSFDSGRDIVEQIFSNGVTSLWRAYTPKYRRLIRNVLECFRHLIRPTYSELSNNHCVLLQEFIPQNDYDIRITIIGKYAMGFARHNRDNDFRASGSGKVDYNIELVSREHIEMAFDISKRLGEPFIAIDFLHSENGLKVIEINFAYASYVVQNCPGHWILDNPDQQPSIRYQHGSISPEELTLQEFIRLNS